MTKEFFLKQIDDILKDYNAIKAKSRFDDFSGPEVGIDEISSIITKSKAAVTRITGEKSEYYKDIDAILKRTNIWDGKKVSYIIGIISALKSDLQNDFLKSLSDIIQSEVFSDYLEMAEHLLNEGYKDPAAVLIGSTLETHLRELCKANGIDTEFLNSKRNLTPKKADSMNTDLAKANVYTGAYQKQVLAWLSIRNSAAHGKYTDYTNEEIKLMLQGVRQFILTSK
jgi:hypothetical protein